MSAIIVVDSLVKAFGFRPVLRGISFAIERGQAIAVLGTNGSGKTTLLRLLAALSRPTAGNILIGGWSLPSEAGAVRAQIGMVSHLPLLYDDLTASENLRFFADLYNLDRQTERITTALEQVGLSHATRDLVRTFSRGMQQRLAIARATIHDPDIMLLDEPYTGLDVKGVEMLDALLRDWRTAGRTIVMSSHDLARVGTICDQALILSQGKIVVNRPIAEIDDLPVLFAQMTG